MAEIKSGKVKKTSPLEVPVDRYEFLNLADAEPDLGAPDVSGKVLTSTTSGGRSWVNTSSLLPGSANQVIYKNSSNIGTGSANLIFDGTTLTGVSALFTGSTTTELMRITQNGTGNALLVEDSTNPDSTPFVINAAGRVGIGLTAPTVALDVFGNTTVGTQVNVAAALGGTTALTSRLLLGSISGDIPFVGSEGAASFSITTDGVSRMRINATGNIVIGSGNPVSYRNLVINKDITGNVSSQGMLISSTIQPDVTDNAQIFKTAVTTAASAFTLNTLTHFSVSQVDLGLGSTVTNQRGFNIESSMTGATYNYGFFGDINHEVGSNRWNLYMGGTAHNYLAGYVGIGVGLTYPTVALDVLGTTIVRAGLTQDGISLQGGATGTSNFKTTLTPATLSADQTLTLPNASGTVALLGTIALGADTTGNYMSGISGTSPVSVAHTAGEGSSATVSLAADYGDTLNPYASKTANYVLASPNGTAGVPTFRAIVAADIPTLNQNTTGNAATATNVAYSGLTGTVPTWNQSTTGNAATVTTNANLTGDVTSVGNATAIAAGVIVDSDINTAAAIDLSKLATTGTMTATTFVGALTGTASGNLVSGGALGTPSSGTLTNCTFPTLNQSTTGSAATWTTARTITLAGDLSGSASVDGSTDVTLTATIAANSIALGTDTTGDYVGTITAGTGVTTSGTSTGEGIAHSISIGQDVATSASPTFAGGIFTGSTSTDLVRITQAGTGNAFVVEDSTNPDSTPFVVDSSGYVGIGTATPFQPASHGALTIDGSTGSIYSARVAGTERFRIQSSATNTNINNVTSTPLFFSTNNTERMRIDVNGNVGIGLAPGAGRNFTVGKFITGNATSHAILVSGEIQTDVTTTVNMVRAAPTTANAGSATTIGTVVHFNAVGITTPGTNVTITTQIGYDVQAGMTGATNCYGYRGSLASATGRYNLYMNGTAQNYLAGNTGIGVTAPTSKLHVSGSFSRGAPVTKTANFTLADTENWITCNGTATITVTLPAASTQVGREIMLKNTAAFTVVSASANIVPLAGGAADTAILPATAGSWVTLVSDGTNWVIMQS